MKEDHCKLTTPDQWLAWQKLTDVIIHKREWTVLRQMDKSYVGEMQKERRDYYERLKEKQNV